MIDVDRQVVRHEFTAGRKLSSLIALSDRRTLLATDEGAHELILLERRQDAVRVAARLAVPPYPVTVQADSNGEACFVASLWSRRLAIVDIQPAGTRGSPGLTLRKTIALPFPPRLQILAGGRLIVADGFSGRLAVVDPDRGEVETVRELPAHNIRGLALNADGSRLLVSHQTLNALARTTPDDVHWGMLMGNVVGSLKLSHVLDKDVDILRGSLVHPLGQPGNAAADPADVALASGGRVVVALAGVGEIGLFREDDSEFHRISVGGRPTTMVLSSDGTRVFVADELRDTVSVVDPGVRRRLAEISLGPQPELTLADRGERLFYDGRLSHDGWMSCHSCHSDGHTSGLLNDNLGDGSFGAPKRVISLLGVARTRPWAWSGEVTELEAQIRKSIETTMRGKTPADESVLALTAFLKTLPPAPPLAEMEEADRGAIDRGRRVFEVRQCARCHSPPDYTSEGAYDVGLKDELGRSKYNPPSLRGVSQRDRLFHDNRAANLDEVFSRFKHQVDELPAHELLDLLVFLKSL